MTNSAYYPQPVPVPVQPSNGLGVAGFIVSLIGLFTCGILCPLGLLFSFFALFKRPRGFAFAGFILGLVGTVFIAGVLLLFGSFVMLAYHGGIKPTLETIKAMDAANSQVQSQYTLNGTLPAEVEMELRLITTKDGWGNPIQYHRVNDTRFELRSAGMDKAYETDDDVVVPHDVRKRGPE